MNTKYRVLPVGLLERVIWEMCNTTATRDSFTKALDDLDAIRNAPVPAAGVLCHGCFSENVIPNHFDEAGKCKAIQTPAGGEPEDVARRETAICALQSLYRFLEDMEQGRTPERDHDLTDAYIKANIGHASKGAKFHRPGLKEAIGYLIDHHMQAEDGSAHVTGLQAERDQFSRMYDSASGALCAIGEALGVDEEDQSTDASLEAITRLQAQVKDLTQTNVTTMALLDGQHEDTLFRLRQIDVLQSELTKAREVITALAKGFNTLDQVCGKYSISMAFSLRDDAWDAYNKLCQFNKLSREIAPVAKDGE
jgi:hypothetical protein